MQNMNCISAQIFRVSEFRVKELGGGKRWIMVHWKEDCSKSNCVVILLLFSNCTDKNDLSLKDIFPYQVHCAGWAVWKPGGLEQRKSDHLY